MNFSKKGLIATLLALAAANSNFPDTALAGQGAQRMLYSIPNSSFIENTSGDSVVTINDTSGLVATLQTAINNARAGHPGSIIVIHLLSGATYSVSSVGIVLNSNECLVGSGAIVEAANSSVTVPLITITNGATNVSIAGGTYDGNGANIYGIFAPASAARVNIDKVTVKNCGQDCIQLNGNGSGYFDNEMTITRCDLSGSPAHSGISIWNATQTTCVDNFCHSNSVGIWMGNCGYANIANNICVSNSTGIKCNSGDDNYVVNNTCDNNGTGIYIGGSGNMIVSDSLATNSVAGINSSGSGNIFSDNLFKPGNAVNFSSNGNGDKVVAYKGALSASGQNYFYPPLIDDQHNTTIVNGMNRYDLYDNSTGPIDNVQNEYNAAVSANPSDVIVLHLNGTYTVGANPLTLSSDTCILLNGTIQINSSTSASQAIYANGANYISISGGTIDGGTTTSSHAGHNAIYFTGCSMFQIDGMTLQNFGTSSTRVGGSDVVRIDHGSTPRIFTRNTIVNGSARGFWLATSGPKDIVSDNTVSGVQMDGVDCDESTSSSLVKFNYLHDNTRYGVFVEQSASYNLFLGNICNNNSSYDIGCYNNSSTPRGATAYNSIICNSLYGKNGLRNGSTGNTNVTTSDNFFFNNTVMSANIQSQLYGSQNYYSQNYMGNSSLSTSGTEVFFNSPDVSGNLEIRDFNSGLDAIVQGAAMTNGAPVITGTATGLGNNLWQLIPTDSGYYKLINQNSGLAMNVSGSSTSAGAPIIQWSFGSGQNDQWMPIPVGNNLYGFINRHSGLVLDVPGASVTPGTQLDQQSSSGAANQRFDLIDTPAPVAQPAGGTWNTNNNANWSTPTAWLDNTIANGEDNTATFSSVITAARTVTLDTSRTIGNIDFRGDNAYTIASSSGSILTLSTSAGTPSIDVPASSTEGVTESDTIGAVLAGNQGFTKTGGGFLALGGPNTITGTISLTGSLRCNTTVSAFNNQSIIETGSANGDSIYFNAAGTYSGNCGIINFGPPETDPDASHLGAIRFATANVILSGTITLLGDAGITPRGANAATISGQITGAHAIRFGRTSTSSSANSGTLILSNPNNNWSGNTTNADGTLKMGAAGVIPNGAGFGNLIMTTPGVEYQLAIAPTIFDLNGFNQTVNGLSHDSGVPPDDLTLLVITNSSANTATLTVGNNNASGNYGGLIKGNKLNLTKTGNDAETLSGANTYGGDTTILSGTLALSGSISNSAVITIASGATLDVSSRSDQTLTLNNGQTLESDGAVNLNLTAGTGATVTPGDSTNIGTLTVTGAAQLQGTTTMKLNAMTGTNDQIVAGSFIFGGSLTVTNVSGTLITGQTFQLFVGDDYSGAFSAMNLPPLTNGLAWNTNNLATDGTLQIVSTAKPQITGITLSGINLILAGTNGTPGEQFVLLSSTNAALPLNQWTPVSTNTFSDENFSVTNTMNPALSQSFYILQLQ